MKVIDALKLLSKYLSKFEAKTIVADYFNLKPLDIYLYLDRDISSDYVLDKVSLAKEGLPLEYIINSAKFLDNYY